MVELEDIPNIHRAPLRQLAPGQGAQILRVDNEFATRAIDSSDQVEQGRFSGSGWPHQREELTS